MNDGKSGLTKELLSLVRQQRHLAMRVVISTQGEHLQLHVTLCDYVPTVANAPRFSLEPTVIPPVILDLTSVAILHRFSSPSWLAHVEKHVAARLGDDEAFDKVVRLEVRHRSSSRIPLSYTSIDDDAYDRPAKRSYSPQPHFASGATKTRTQRASSSSAVVTT